MMPVDSFAGSARVKMAAAIEASTGTAAAARATRARGVSIDRYMRSSYPNYQDKMLFVSRCASKKSHAISLGQF